MKKYAILTTVDASLSAFLLPVAFALQKEGIDITLISSMSEEFYNKYSKIFTCYNVSMKRGFHLKSLVTTFVTLCKIFRTEKYDVIEYATENVSFPASIAGWLFGIPVRIYDHWGARYIGLMGWERRISWILEKITARCSTTIRQVSEKNKLLCAQDKLYKTSKCVVLGRGGTIGVDFSRFDKFHAEEWRRKIRSELGIPQDANVLGFVGRIQTDKGINELLSAFREIQHENCYLVLVGPIDSENPIQKENMEYAQKNEKIIFTGKLNHVQEVLCAFDILVHPTYREGFGMILQEAAAMDIPIITTDIIGPNEFVNNNETGILVPPKESQALLHAINSLLQDFSKRKQIAENAYQYTKKYFDRDIMVSRIVEDRKKLLK